MDSPEDERFRRALDELLTGDTFARSPAVARLLTYLVEQVLTGEAASLKESVIGHVLYGRPASYDPKLDSVVRVSANRLRARIEDHYRANPGAQDRIVLPRGSYVPLLQAHDGAVASTPSKTDVEQAASDITASPRAASGLEASEQNDVKPSAYGVPRSWKFRSALAGLLLGIVLLGSLVWMHARRRATESAGADWSVRPFARLGGSQQFGAFSPDGTQLAFTSTGTHSENKMIYTQATDSEDAHEIAAGVRPAWSPDGKRLAFLRPEADGKKLIILYDLLAKKETTLTEITGLAPWLCEVPRLSWSRDGKVLYSTASAGGNAPCGLVAIDSASGQVRAVIPPATVLGDQEAAVSPDGLTIAFLRCLDHGASDVFVLNTRRGEVRRITNDGTDIVGFDWSSDGKALIVASNREGGTRKLWRVPIDGNPAQALTDGSSAPTFPSVSANGKEINFTQFHVTSPIWKIEGGQKAEILENQSKNETPVVSPDGKKMLYASDRTGKWEVWLSDVDGRESRPLLAGTTYTTRSPRWSPDGSQIVMECQIEKQARVCLSSAEGKGFRQLIAGDVGQIKPSWSHDGKSIYFTAAISGRYEIYRTDVASGALQPMTHRGGSRALESWDGQWLFVARGEPDGGMFALPLQGTEQERQAAEDTQLLNLNPHIGAAWDTCKDGVVYLASDDKNPPRLEVFDMKTRKATALVTLGDLFAETDQAIGTLPDGKGVLFTAASTHSELNIMAPR